MARIGYARVSSLDQDLEGQLARLAAEGCSIIRSEKVSGGSREGRPELAIVLQFLRADDELVVTRLDRLGRDTRDVLNLIYECEERGASVTVLDPHVSTRGEMGHFVLTVLGMVAQMERRFIKEREREGIQRAKTEGRYLGGKRRIDRVRVFLRHRWRKRGDDRHRTRVQPYAGLPRSCGQSVRSASRPFRTSWAASLIPVSRHPPYPQVREAKR